MSIIGLEGINPGDLFTAGGKDVWRVDWIQPKPTLALRNLTTGRVVHAAVGSPALDDFVPLIRQVPEMKWSQPIGVKL